MDPRGRRRETMAPFIGPQRSIIRHGRLLDVLMSRTHCRLITVAFIIPAQQGASSPFPSLSLFSLSLIARRTQFPINRPSSPGVGATLNPARFIVRGKRRAFYERKMQIMAEHQVTRPLI